MLWDMRMYCEYSDDGDWKIVHTIHWEILLWIRIYVG